MVPIKKKTEKREAAREAKALTAARLEKSLERELIARLKSRAYGDQPLNVNEDVWQAVLNREKEVEAEKELEELGMESDDETDSEQEGEYEDGDEEGQFVSDFDESDVEDMEEYDGEVRCEVSVHSFLASRGTDVKNLASHSLDRRKSSLRKETRRIQMKRKKLEIPKLMSQHRREANARLGKNRKQTQRVKGKLLHQRRNREEVRPIPRKFLSCCRG